MGVSPAGNRVSQSRTWKDCFGKMPKPAGETPTLPETVASGNRGGIVSAYA